MGYIYISPIIIIILVQIVFITTFYFYRIGSIFESNLNYEKNDSNSDAKWEAHPIYPIWLSPCLLIIPLWNERAEHVATANELVIIN